MKKRLLSTLLALCMALALLPVTTLAADADFLIENGVLKEYNGPGGDVVIPDGVTTIQYLSFAHCDTLTSVVISNGVTHIDAAAFGDCANLTSVTIPVSVTYIGQYAFDMCYNLADVYYGGSESQWAEIKIGLDNRPLDNAAIHYNNVVPSAPAQPEQPSAPGDSSSISVTVGGTAVMWTDAAPFIDANSRTMVPLRAVADAMELTVNWDGDAREASFSDGGKTIYFPIDSNSARTSDGGAVQMDTAAVIANDRTYAPIRYLAEFFGYTVGWDGATQTVSLTK